MTAIILTPNKRLSKQLLTDYAKEQSNVFALPNILAWDVWIYDCYQQAAMRGFIEPKHILTPEESTLLWENIIQQEYTGLTAKSVLAKLAQETFKLCQQHGISLDEAELSNDVESQAFQRWAKQYLKTLNQKKWIDTAMLAETLLPHIQNLISQPVEIAGFHDPSPIQKHYFKGLNVKVKTFSKIPCESKTCYAFDSEDSELQAIAQFATGYYKRSPEKSLGIIVNSMNRLYGKLSRYLKIAFDTTFEDNHSQPYSISFGQALSQNPACKTALAILNLEQFNSPKLISELLKSPFLPGYEDELAERANIETKLHHETFKLSLTKTLYLFANSPKLCASFNGIKLYERKNLTPAEWVSVFITRLQLFSFPNGNLSSENYQAMQSFEAILANFANNVIETRISSKKALQLLKSACKNHLFQAESNPKAKIHIMGVLEAADIQFDTLWFSGLSELDWPPTRKVNAILPKTLQKTYCLPGSDSEKHALFYQALLKNSQENCQSFIASYVELKDGIKIQSDKGLSHFQIQTYSKKSINNHPKLESFEDSNAPKVTQQKKAKGGSSIIKNQAICPFKAFAENRLNARPLTPFTTGLDARSRGNLVHSILETLWREIQSQSNLLALSETTLQKTIEAAIMHHLKNYAQAFHFHIETEKKRLNQLIYAWFDIEKMRKAFDVENIELETTLKLHSLELTLRLDRLDKTSDGSYILIDYKTSKKSPMLWLDERPEEPQLPLYVLALQNTLGAISFAVIHPNDMGFYGYSVQKGILPKVSEPKGQTLENLHDSWRQALENLAQDFENGVATVDPKRGKASCTDHFCKLHGFCRINELA